MPLLRKIANIKKEDLDEIEEWLDDCEISDTEIVDFIREQVDELDCFLWDINLKSLVFEYILNKADVSELIEYIHVDEKTNELSLSTTKIMIDEILENVLVEDRNDSWLFLVEYLSADAILEDQKN